MLDLTQSEVKVARAREHCKTLKREIDAVLEKQKPYTLSGEINAKTGWLRAFIHTPDVIPNHGLSVIVGDAIHNLRCALDYIVTALVDASNAQLSGNHQFPIFDDRDAYQAQVGTDKQAVPKGRLGGVTRGLNEIWQMQPFHCSDPEDTALFMINRFSNADKHRMIVENWIDIRATQIKLIVPAGEEANIVDEAQPATAITLEPDGKYEVARLRFVAPYPSKVRLDATSGVGVKFGAPAFGRYKLGHALHAEHLEALCDYVAKALEVFKTV